ncbi:hypothetical protein HY256_12095, partial [Candidatus Sumerlaeota bacterium]|nr:hypothetical protein [Candidatus Sumerlaeota bacterium]
MKVIWRILNAACIKAAVALCIFLLPLTSPGQPGSLRLTITDPLSSGNDLLGYSIATQGTNAIFGAYQGDFGASSDSGCVVIFNGVTGDRIMRIDNPTPANFDWFGFSVAAVGGNKILVGAIYDDTGATDAGSAYLFDGTTGALLLTINNPSPTLDGRFGWAVADVGGNLAVSATHNGSGKVYIFDGSLTGTTNTPLVTISNPGTGGDFGISAAGVAGNVLVGAYLNSSSTIGGQAYLFDGTSGSLILTINNPTPASSDLFGMSVAALGTDLLVSAVFDDTGAANAGSVYLFDGSLTGTTSTPLLTINNPTPGAGDEFGSSLASMGSYVIIGAHFDDTTATDGGAAFVFDGTLRGTTNSPVLTLNNPTPALNDYFGQSVGAVGADILVGAYQDDTKSTNAGATYEFCGPLSACPTVTPSASPTPSNSPTASPSPSTSPSVSPSPTPSASRTPSASPTESPSRTPSATSSPSRTPTASPTPTPTLCPAFLTINNPSPNTNDWFSFAVAGVGNNALIGALYDDTDATDAGIAYLFDGSTGGLLLTLHNPTPAMDDEFGESVAAVGNNILVGCPRNDTGASNAGSAYLFDGTTGALLLTINNPNPVAGDEFGNRVAAIGTNLVIAAWQADVGATDAGVVYVFDGTQTGTTSTPILTINNPAPGPAAGDSFGYSLAVAGTNVVVASIYDDAGATDSGTVYVFDGTQTGTTNIPLFTINNPTPGLDDRFGQALGNVGNNILVGVPLDDVPTQNEGRAYLFNGVTGSIILTINNPAPTTNDFFGIYVAALGNDIIVGAHQDDFGASNTGRVYVFDGNQTGTTNSPYLTINNPAPGILDEFGWAVASVGTDILVSTVVDDAGFADSGTAYIFHGPNSICPTQTPTPSPSTSPSKTPTASPSASSSPTSSVTP